MESEHLLRIGERRYTVTQRTREPGRSYEIVVDGRSFAVTLAPGVGHLPSARVDGRLVPLAAARCEEGTWVWADGAARLVRDGSRERRRSGNGQESGGRVTPATPGVVVKLLVAEGDAVTQGQPLLVVSAMKMETTLVAAHAGRVRAVKVAEGETVKPGDVLVEIEPARVEEGAGD